MFEGNTWETDFVSSQRWFDGYWESTVAYKAIILLNMHPAQ